MTNANYTMIIVSGLSGAGKSTALHALEDLGFFCTDNLPVEMLEAWSTSVRNHHERAAVCLDVRSFQGSETLALPEIQGQCLTLFVDADDEVLQQRFSTLRRKHPFHHDGNTTLEASIQSERQALNTIRQQADMVLDSSMLNPYELADLIETFWLEQGDNRVYNRTPNCTLYSFSYRRGLPKSADMVLDARYLPNPHYITHLAPMTGQDAAIHDFFTQYPEVSESIQHIEQWLSFLWPRLKRERKQYFTLAIGCSGGRHRSVYLIESIARWMREEELCQPLVIHREL
jgi:UPF0042 nucleotide-binding protein